MKLIHKNYEYRTTYRRTPDKYDIYFIEGYRKNYTEYYAHKDGVWYFTDLRGGAFTHYMQVAWYVAVELEYKLSRYNREKKLERICKGNII